MGLEWLILERVSIGWWLLEERCNGVVAIGNLRRLSMDKRIVETVGWFRDKWDATNVTQEIGWKY